MEAKNYNKMKAKTKMGLISSKIKTTIFFGIFCFGILSDSIGQLDSYLINMQAGHDFYFIRDKMDAYLDSLETTMDSIYFYSGGGEFKEFKKFEKLWEPRVSPHGDFIKYFDAEYNFYENLQDSYEYITEGPWHELGPNAVNYSNINKGVGPVEFLTFFDNGTPGSTQYMLTGSLPGGLFYSTDFGNTWNKTGTDTQWAQSGCSWAVFHPNNHNLWYASSSGNGSAKSRMIGKTGGIFRTTDEGQNLEQIANKDDLQSEWTIIYKLLIDPLNPSILYAATSIGVFKTTDCESSDPSWTLELSGFTYDMEMKPNDNSTLYSSTYFDGYWKIMISQNYGDDWEAMQFQPETLSISSTDNQFFTIEVSKAKPGYIYSIARDGTSYSFYYYDLDIGNGWDLIASQTDNNGFGGGHGFGVEQVVNGEEIVVSFITRLRKYNINTGSHNEYYVVHVDVEDVIYHPYNSGEVWACTHGGVEKSSDGGVNWEAKYDGLGVAQVEKMATSYTNPEYILTGLYHDGVQLTDSEYEPNWNPTWNLLQGFFVDGMKPLIDNKDPNHMWGSGQKGMWKYTPDVFNTYPYHNVSNMGTAYWLTIGVLNKQDPSVFFRNKYKANPDEEVFRSTDRGLSTGVNEFISFFKTQLQTLNRINILGLYTPYNNGDYLYAHLYDEEPINKDRTWHVFLTKNTNAAANDVIWEELPIPRSDSWISAIEFDPDNPDIIYLAYSGSANENNWPYANEMIYKIDCSVAESIDYTDISLNLPYTVARENCIAAEKGSNGGVYFATEFGVFYTNNELMNNAGNEWMLVGKELPHIPSNGIEINYICNSLRLGTWGRGVWEIPLPCLYSNQPLMIANDTNWNSFMRLDRSVIVSSGATLTINEEARIAFPDEAKIIVEQGAKLILDGGILTNACDSLWQGIEVWGDASANQFPDTNGYIQQGYLVLKNGAMIENAISAVELWEPGEYEKTGGIVQATDAIFRNSAKSVHALYYTNFHPVPPHKEMDNLSYFKNCTFEINEDYIPTQTFYKHVDLAYVKGIKFKGCDFTVADVPGVSPWNNAIAAYSAGFSVSPICTSQTVPCSEYDSCYFNGFYNAISASGTNSYTFSVSRAVFVNNTYGIKVEGVNNLSVLFSDFFIGHNATDEEECEGKGLNAAGYGISLTNSTGFAIEENYFTKATSAPSGNYVGISIAETQAADEIYKNTFEGLSYANYTEGKNWCGIETYKGLTFFCNENAGNFEDFTVQKLDGVGGIQSEIGSTELPAGNTFTVNANYNFYNDGNHGIGYFYYTGNPAEYPEIVYHVTREPVSIQNGCPSHYGGGGGGTDRGLVLTPEQKQEAEQEFATNLTDYNNVRALYENFKDGGNTEVLITDVETAWPSDMWELRAKLLGDSPHLSMEVLKKAADKTDVLPESVIFEIMAANPDELKKEELIKYLEDKENPLPDYMIEILRQVSTGTTYKTVLHRQMAYYNRNKTRAAHDIIRSLLNDTLTDYSELRNWLDNLGGIRADEQIIATYLQEGNYSDALALADMMPALYGYDEEELAEHGYYMNMLNLQISLTQQGRNIFELDSAELSNLVFITENSTGTASSQSKGILEFAYGYEYCNCLNVSDTSGYKSSDVINPDALGKVYGFEVSVEPNPASDWVAFNYTLPDDKSEGVIKISDVSGKLITTLTISGKQGQKVWDTRKIKPGVYFYTLTINGISKSGKVVISK